MKRQQSCGGIEKANYLYVCVHACTHNSPTEGLALKVDPVVSAKTLSMTFKVRQILLGEMEEEQRVGFSLSHSFSLSLPPPPPSPLHSRYLLFSLSLSILF